MPLVKIVLSRQGTRILLSANRQNGRRNHHMKLTKEWAIAAAIRAIKTVAQTALGMFTIGAAFSEIKWGYVISVSLVAGIYSLLTSLAGLPETKTDGTLLVDTSNPERDIYRMELNDDISKLAEKSSVRFAVNSNANLSQE